MFNGPYIMKKAQRMILFFKKYSSNADKLVKLYYNYIAAFSQLNLYYYFFYRRILLSS